MTGKDMASLRVDLEALRKAELASSKEGRKMAELESLLRRP